MVLDRIQLFSDLKDSLLLISENRCLNIRCLYLGHLLLIDKKFIVSQTWLRGLNLELNVSPFELDSL